MRSLIMFILLSLNAFSQKAGENYAKYYEEIIMAEDAVSREDLAAALTLYANIFNQYRPFARDTYNACQIAGKLEDSRFGDFFLACARSGITRTRLMNNHHISKVFYKDVALYDKLFQQGRAEYEKCIDGALRKEFEQRYSLEQQSKSKPNYNSVCTDNFDRIVELAKEGRFPGEGLIGPGEDMGSGLAGPTLLHYPYSYVELKDKLWQAVLKGNIQPGEVLYIYGFNQTRTSVLYTPDIPVDTENFKDCFNIPFGKMSDDIEEVDRQRKLHYIVSAATQKRLEKFAFTYKLDYRLPF